MLTLVAASLLQVGQVAIIEFGGEWCAPCKQQAPITRRLEADGVKVYHVDYDRHRPVADAWKVTSMPTLIVVSLRDVNGRRVGKELRRFVGVTDYNTLRGSLPKAVSTDISNEGSLAGDLPVWDSSRFWVIGLTAPASLAPPLPFQPGPLLPLSSQPKPAQDDEGRPKAPDPLNVEDVRELALACHVRVRVDFGRSTNWGSGTIIERFKDGKRCTVLTNKHVIRTGGVISIDDGTGYWAGARCEEVWPKGSGIPADDLAVVMVHRAAPTNARLCDLGYKPVCPLYVVGSAHGDVPRVREIHAVRSFRATDGGWNMVMSKESVSGDSGGGVYDSAGYLVGTVWGTSDDGARAVDLTKSPVLYPETRKSSQSGTSP